MVCPAGQIRDSLCIDCQCELRLCFWCGLVKCVSDFDEVSLPRSIKDEENNRKFNNYICIQCLEGLILNKEKEE